MDYTVLRFWSAEVFDNMEGVLDTILASLEATPPHPTLSPQAGRGDEQLA
jgi:very-short-patch-repair endonuclease